MKKFTKLLGIVLIIALVMSMGITAAFAADDGTITILNTVKEKTYNVYKIFDATYSGSGENMKVAYTYDGSNATFLAALQAENSPFLCTAMSDGKYSIAVKDGVQDDAIITFIKGQAANFGSAVETITGTGDTLTLDNMPYGYYYITTTTGTTVTIDSALKDVTVIDKNETIPGPDKQEMVEAGTWVYQGIDKEEDPIPTASVGDTVSYKVVGSFSRYEGEELVTNLVFTDTMSAGLTANQNVVLKVNGETLTKDTNYTVTYSQNANKQWVTVITLTTATVDPTTKDITFLFETPSTYEITYSAVINEDSIIDNTEENTVDLKYNDDNDVDTDTTKVVNYNITLTKVDAQDSTKKLAGAQFKLYDAATAGNEIPVVLVPQVVAEGETADAKYGTKDSEVNNVYRPAKTGETGVEMVTGKTGIIEVKGLKNGSYFFEETKAPETYNILQGRTEAATINNANATISVQNNSGTVLPSTGGIGTTIFYVVGSILVVAAGVLLITKKRMSREG